MFTSLVSVSVSPKKQAQERCGFVTLHAERHQREIRALEDPERKLAWDMADFIVCARRKKSKQKAKRPEREGVPIVLVALPLCKRARI